MKRLKAIPFKGTWTPYVVPNPFGVDVVVKELQTTMGNIDWIEKSFGRIIPMIEKREGKDYKFPAVFIAEGFDFLDLLLQDNFKAYSFFAYRGAEEVVEFVEYAQNTYSRGLDLIVWADLNQVDPDRRDDFFEELKKQVRDKVLLTSNYRSDNDEIISVELNKVHDDPKDVFVGYSLDLADSRFLDYPFKGMRLELTVTYLQTPDSCVPEYEEPAPPVVIIKNSDESYLVEKTSPSTHLLTDQTITIEAGGAEVATVNHAAMVAQTIELTDYIDMQKLNALPNGWLNIALSDNSTDLAADASNPVETLYFPETYELDASGAIRLICDPDDLPTGAVIEVDIKKNGSSIFTTTLTIDAGENDSLNAATSYELTSDPAAIQFTNSDKIEFFILTVGSTTTGKGLKIQLLLKQPSA